MDNHEGNKMTNTAAPRGLRLTEVCDRVGCSRQTIWRMVNSGQFPKPIPISERVKVWPADELDAWLESRRAAS